MQTYIEILKRGKSWKQISILNMNQNIILDFKVGEIDAWTIAKLLEESFAEASMFGVHIDIPVKSLKGLVIGELAFALRERNDIYDLDVK